jgi:hypothetical protein
VAVAAIAAVAAAAPPSVTLNATVDFGVLSVDGEPPRASGLAFSALNAVVASLFAPAQPLPAVSTPGASLLSSRSGLLSYMVVCNGTYLVDEPLSLVRQLVTLCMRGERGTRRETCGGCHRPRRGWQRRGKGKGGSEGTGSAVEKLVAGETIRHGLANHTFILAPP